MAVIAAKHLIVNAKINGYIPLTKKKGAIAWRLNKVKSRFKYE